MAIIDPNLSVRLDALKRDLQHALTPSAWEGLDLPNVWKQERVWKRLDTPIRQLVEPLLNSLEEIRKKLEQIGQDNPDVGQVLENAWQDFARVYKSSQKIFPECLELIGGLVLRDKLLDDGICQMADELINTCSTEVGEWPTLTIPASQEALTKTLGRIIRFRFPEWTIWTLPFTAHEYGHVVIDENNALREFVSKEVQHIVDQEIKANRLVETDKEHAIKRVEYHVEELLADAFAAYTMGPAYGCATLLHRFNPWSAYEEDDEHPSDARRAQIVLAMLERMNEETDTQVYEKVIDFLNIEWNRILFQPDCKLESTDLDYLKKLVKSVWSIFDHEFKEALYPDRHDNGGWRTARDWAEQWQDELSQNNPLSTPKVSRDQKLRGALNAAWYCRILYHQKVASPQDVGVDPQNAQMLSTIVNQIARATQKLCEDIIEDRTKGATKRLRAGRNKRINRTRG